MGREIPWHVQEDWRKRETGIIPRRKRKANELTVRQIRLAERMQDTYETSWEQATTYLDWFAALSKGWITRETFIAEICMHLEEPKRRRSRNHMDQEQKDIILNFLKEKLEYYDYALPRQEADVNAQPEGVLKEAYESTLYKLRVEATLLHSYVAELEEDDEE